MGQLAAALALGIRGTTAANADSVELPEAVDVGATLRVPCPLVIRNSVGVPRTASQPSLGGAAERQ
jgi:hypothetical protein